MRPSELHAMLALTGTVSNGQFDVLNKVKLKDETAKSCCTTANCVELTTIAIEMSTKNKNILFFLFHVY